MKTYPKHIIGKLCKQGLITPPAYVIYDLQYLATVGSVAYGLENDKSDVDLGGFCIPNKELIFPHLSGKIQGFDQDISKFDQYQKHHVECADAQKEYDMTIFSIIKIFKLCAEGNPNALDLLFVPRRCLLHTTQVGEFVREHRKLFLSKEIWHRFKGYAFSQMHKMHLKNPQLGSNRAKNVEEYGYDTKFGYHVIRLLGQAEQILTEHDMDLERNREQLKAIRRGEWTEKDITDLFTKKEKELETIYLKSVLRNKANRDKLKEVLITALEMHFENLDKEIVIVDKYKIAVDKISKIVEKL